MNLKTLFAFVSTAALLAVPLARAHDWHRHDDPQFANRPFISPYAVGPKAGAVRLLSASDVSRVMLSGEPSAGPTTSFAPATLGAANLFAQTFVKFNPAVRFWWDSTSFYVESDGTPAHNMMEGISSWQRQIPLPTYYFGTNQWTLPLYPVAAATNDPVATNKFTQGAIALAANGIPIFNPYNNTGRLSAQIGELDYWGGHCGRGDDYHYHAAPLHLTNTLGVSLPLAFAMDGYPVYGLVEPDGSAFNTNTLDNVAGHTNFTGSYHYHSSSNFPYVNGGFHGVITILTNGQATQAGNQPRAGGVRPAGTPLNGAYIQIFTNIAPDQFQMFYSLPSNSSPSFATNYWLYTLNRASNSVTVTYSSYDGVSGPTTTNYSNWKPAPAFTSTNEPLVTTQPTNLTLASGATANFSITAAGFGSLAYQWLKDGVELANGGGIGGVNTTTLILTNVQAGDAGAYSVVVTNSVGITLSAASVLAISGAPSNTPPTLTTISNRTLLPGATLIITNVASDAETPGLLTFRLTNSPADASINTNTGVLMWATSVTNANTTNPFTVVVADNGSPSLAASQSFTVTVLGIGGTNTAPVFAAVTNRYVINGGDTLVVTNTATDAEAPPQMLAYSLLTAPVGATINTNTGVVTWITTTNNSGTSNSFRVVVTDNGSPTLSATNSFTVFVRSLRPNVVLIVTDDQGFHDISAHGAEAPTPNMDRIGSEGIRLERFYPTPVCSVTRSTLLTGRSPNRTSVGNTHGLDLREHIMPVTFKAAGYQTFMCGKWHLGGLYNNTNTTVINGVTNTVVRENADYQPQVRGWDTHYGEYTGAINYLAHTSQENGQLDWWLNGQTNLDAGWSTDLLAGKAMQLLQQRDPSKPVILYLAFNAVHPGVSAPTNYLNKYLGITNNLRRTMVAALDQMDVGIGRVLDTIDSEGIGTNTLVVYFSDNGADTNSGGLNIPLRGTKSDLFDAGIHTPAAVRWPGVLPAGITNCQQFMWSGDWFPTICAATGVTPLNTKPFDGVNMWPLLLTATNGAFNPINYRGSPLVSGSSAGSGIFDVFTNTNGAPTMFKLIRDRLAGNTFTNYLFDIINDPYESNDVVNVPAYSNIVATLSTYYSNITAESYSPYIGANPTSQTVTAGTNVTLWAMTTVYPKQLTTQWRKGGTNLVGQTNRTTLETSCYLARLDLTNVTAADAGNYDVVVTDNAVGWPTTVTSLVAVVTVNLASTNTAPVLGVISNRTINVGSTLLVTNVATDAEVPPQVLAFNLLSPPANASINSGSGVLTFAPVAGQAGTTNTMTVVVTDNGTPVLSATNSFLVTVLSNASPFLTISGVTNSPASPTSNNAAWITASIASSTTVTQAVLSYGTGGGGPGTTNFVFIETMAAISNAAWDGTGADNLWTVVTTGGAGNVKQASNANHTAVGAGGQCGMEMGKGTTNAAENMVTTVSNINATGATGYVEFWLQTINVTNGLGWNFQLSTNGTTFTTRLSETDGTVHGFANYHYDLLPSERVSTLKLRFQFIGNAVGGATGPKVRVDDIVVATATAGGPSFTNIAMLDDGAHQDGAAGDGVYGGQIPAFPTGTTVNYFVTAANSGGLTATNPATAPGTNYFYTVAAPAAPTVAYDVLLGRPTDTSIAVSLLSSNDLQAYYEYGTQSGIYTGQTATNSITNGIPSVATIGALQANQKYFYRLRYTTNGAPFSAGTERTFRTQRARGSTFTFLIEADPHNRDNVPEVWKLAFTNMLADNADFLLDLGDTFFEEKVAATNAYYLTRPGIFELHQEVRNGFFGLAGHSLPTFLVSGNHDPELGWLLSGTNNPAVWGVQARQHFFPVPNPGTFYSGATNVDPYTLSPRDGYYAFEWGDALFVTLDPYWYSAPKPNADGWAWTLGTNQYFWLKQTLENSTAKFKFVFAHHLIGGGGGGEARGGLAYHENFEWGGYTTNGAYDFPTKRPGWPAPIKDLLLSNNVQAFFHGHDHLYVKEDYFAPGNTSAVPTFVYQEVPQPSQAIYGTNAAPGYGYTNVGSVVLPGSGHLRVTVSPTNALVEYLRVFLPANEGTGKTNRMISHSYNIPAPAMSIGWSMLKLPDTDQTNSYTTTPGEDSDYVINPTSYTDNANGTVTDNVTGLIWQKVDGGEMTWSNALSYAATNTLAGVSAGTWRLPSIHELASIAIYYRNNPPYVTNYFSSGGPTNAEYWWSRDTLATDASRVWVGNAGGGIGPKVQTETISAGGTLRYHARLVRGTLPPGGSPIHHFVNNGNGTITDTDTALTWQQAEVGAQTDWTNALIYAEGLVLGGFQDWRLPNIKELESLNDETLASPSIDTNFFPNAKSARYWSSTTQNNATSNAWFNEFIAGITSQSPKVTNYWVRAVRGGMTNTAPNLTAISNRTINAGVTVQFTNAASDAQTAPGFLAFTLLTTVTNAALGTTNGIFTWRAPVAQAGTTNQFTVVVTDTGSPLLNTTQSFLVTVNPLLRPAVTEAALTNDLVQLQITGDTGPDYTVQATTNLAAPLGGWTNLYTTNSPVTPFQWLDPNANSYTSRFYRVRLGP